MYLPMGCWVKSSGTVHVQWPMQDLIISDSEILSCSLEQCPMSYECRQS
jgi:hypothetical protein